MTQASQFEPMLGGRMQVLNEFNTFLAERLPHAVVFTRDQQVQLDPDGGCYAVYTGKGSQNRGSADLCGTGRTMPMLVDCYGADLEQANRLFDMLFTLLSTAQLRHSRILRCEDEVLIQTETQTDAVRATILLQYVA